MSDTRATTERLIDRLGEELQPVRPLRPPLLRWLLWLPLVLAPAAVAIAWRGHPGYFVARLNEPRFVIEWVATLTTGLLAVLASLNLSVPGRSESWRYAPLPPLALWLAMGGLGCLRNGIGAVDPHCLRFILLSSVPLSILVFLLLRPARPYAPGPVALTGALGVAALGAALLQFFHPFDVTVLDLGTHLLAIMLVVAVGSALGRRQLASA